MVSVCSATSGRSAASCRRPDRNNTDVRYRHSGNAPVAKICRFTIAAQQQMQRAVYGRPFSAASVLPTLVAFESLISAHRYAPAQLQSDAADQ